MTHNNPYAEDSSVFNVTKASTWCGSTNCYTNCTCKTANGWSASAPSGTANLDYTSKKSSHKYADLGNKERTCYHTCTHTPSTSTGSCASGYTRNLTSCGDWYNYTSTTDTTDKTTYTSTPSGCSKAESTVSVTCGKCTPKPCPSGYTAGLADCSGKPHPSGWTYSSSSKSGEQVCGKCTANSCPDGYWTGCSAVTSDATSTHKLDQQNTDYYAGDSRCYNCTYPCKNYSSESTCTNDGGYFCSSKYAYGKTCYNRGSAKTCTDHGYKAGDFTPGYYGKTHSVKLGDKNGTCYEDVGECKYECTSGYYYPWKHDYIERKNIPDGYEMGDNESTAELKSYTNHNCDSEYDGEDYCVDAVKVASCNVSECSSYQSGNDTYVVSCPAGCKVPQNIKYNGAGKAYTFSGCKDTNSNSWGGYDTCQKAEDEEACHLETVDNLKWTLNGCN